MGILAPTGLRPWPSERESMPLLRSLADRAARVAINVALLTELFASPPPPLRRVKDACKVQGQSPHSHSNLLRSAFLALSQSITCSLPSARRRSVSANSFTCQAGDSNSVSGRLKKR